MSCDDSPTSELSITDIASSMNAEDVKRIKLIIEEKEKDLELAAKIGKSLLDQNRELRDRNEFLEESLVYSNESITQLKHQLQQRSSLLNAVCDFDEEYYDEKETESSSKQQEKLERRVKQLEKENTTLKDEGNSLKEFICESELQSRDKINQYLRQLENANVKIAKLHGEITEKNAECVIQAEEIKKLVKEVQQRKCLEKNVTQENFDLAKQLSEAINLHDQLEIDVSHLQDAYTEVRAKLHEAESELGVFRLKALPYRSGSSDSLYDSLASEMEINDSGFFGTPMISARTDSSHSDFYSPGSSTDKRVDSDSNECYEVPSKALMESVRRNIRKLREKSPSLADEMSPAAITDRSDDPKTSFGGLESIKEAQSPSHLSMSESLLTIKESMPKPPQLSHSESSESDPEDPELRFDVEDCVPTTSAAVVSVELREQKTFRDASCSPIPELSSDWPRVSAPKKWLRGRTDSLLEESVTPDAQVSPLTSDTEDTPRALGPLLKSGSNDSLCQYNGPRLGEPGKPGTRDLEYSLKKSNLKRQIEKDYQRFRQVRGLPPVSGFFVNLDEKSSPRMCGPLSSQLEYLSSSPRAEMARIPLIARPFPTPKTLAFGKSNWQREHLGLTAAFCEGSNNGVIQRNMQSPTTPTLGSKSAESTPTHLAFRSQHGSSFIQALGLNTLVQGDSDVPRQPTTRSIFRSPLLVGSFEAIRELSPPFGGSPTSDGLDMMSASMSFS